MRYGYNGVMRWTLFQASIIGGVMCANIYWKLTPNGYLASLIGVGLAYLATLGLVALIDRAKVHSARRDSLARYSEFLEPHRLTEGAPVRADLRRASID